MKNLPMYPDPFSDPGRTDPERSIDDTFHTVKMTELRRPSSMRDDRCDPDPRTSDGLIYDIVVDQGGNAGIR
jgi:hypothetical protein